VASFTLISTDKAVRPTNVMGASKRAAELMIQALAQELPATRLAMVRFGNVLGSSGSVVPLFREQIAEGGPITLTHPEIIRFFMTIPEAAQLVLQAAVLARGGDLFLLDMGEPVRILDLAKQMVRLSGLSLRDGQHPQGDIEIICTGLRPGEKLYEELLIDAESEPTSHPLIYRATEGAIPPEQLWPQIEAMEAAIQRQDAAAALDVLAQLVPEWQRGE
jgi:FlaA1/EpsC-like NDP-sugar epimerase